MDNKDADTDILLEGPMLAGLVCLTVVTIHAAGLVSLAVATSHYPLQTSKGQAVQAQPSPPFFHRVKPACKTAFL